MGSFTGAGPRIPIDQQDRLIVAVDSVPAGGASEAKQDAILAALVDVVANTTGLSTEITLAAVRAAVEAGNTTLGSILTALGSLATSVDVAAVEAAIVALGGGSSLADIEAALAPLATEATQALIKAELEAQGLTLDTISSTLTTIESDVDDVESLLTATNTKLDAIKATLDELAAVVDDPLFHAEFHGSIADRQADSVLILGRRTSFPSPNVLTAVVGYAASSAMPPIMTGAESLEIVSSSADDTAAGSGVQKVRISYIDANSSPVGQRVAVEFNLNGTTPVALTGVSALHINYFCGENTTDRHAVAAGNITIRNAAAPATEYGVIAAGGNRSQDGVYMVPAGYTLYLRRWNGSVTAAAGSARGQWRPLATMTCDPPHVKTTTYHFVGEAETSAGQSTGDRDMSWYPVYESALVMLAVNPSATASFTASASLDGVLVANP